MITEAPTLHFLYKITNEVNKKVYIGQTTDIKERWLDHKAKSRQNKPKMAISKAIKKYGVENFTIEVIASCKSYENANEIEEILIKQYESHISFKKGYNVALGGKNSPMSEYTKEKISQASIGEKNPFYGKTHSEESLEKIKIARSEQIITEEQKQKTSRTMKGIPKKISHSAWNRGISKFPVDQIIDARKSGLTYTQIVKQFGISLSTLSKMLNQVGLGK